MVASATSLPSTASSRSRSSPSDSNGLRDRRERALAQGRLDPRLGRGADVVAHDRQGGRPLVGIQQVGAVDGLALGRGAPLHAPVLRLAMTRRVARAVAARTSSPVSLARRAERVAGGLELLEAQVRLALEHEQLVPVVRRAASAPERQHAGQRLERAVVVARVEEPLDLRLAGPGVRLPARPSCPPGPGAATGREAGAAGARPATGASASPAIKTKVRRMADPRVEKAPARRSKSARRRSEVRARQIVPRGSAAGPEIARRGSACAFERVAGAGGAPPSHGSLPW
jgi:hypothetical protein